MRAIIYTRVSSDEQVKGTSLDDQENRCRQYCFEKGLVISRIFREEGASAKSTDRPEFLNSIEYCRKNRNKVDAFVVWKLDRFARNVHDHVMVKKTLLDYKVTLHSVSEPISDEPVGRVFETILAAFSEFDNEIRKQRCTNGMIAKLQQGIWPWKPPIGYRCAHYKKRGERKIGADPPDEATFPIIQRGLQEFARGTFASQVQLAEALDNWGLSDIRGEEMHRQLVDRILGKFLPFYAGILVNPWTGEQVQGLHKAMITREEMERIRLIRAGKGRSSRPMKRDRHNPAFPLKGTVICASCNRPLTGSAPRGNGGRYCYYHCKNSACAEYAKSIPKATLEADFVEFLKRITPNERVLTVIRETVKDIWEEKRMSIKLEARRREKTIASLKDRKMRICELLEEGTYTGSYGKERLAELDNKLMTANIALSEAQTDQFDTEAAISYATHFVSNLSRQWFDLAPELRPRFQKLIFPEGAPYSRSAGFGTAKLGLIYELNARSGGDLSRVVDLMGCSWNQFVVECLEWRRLGMALAAKISNCLEE